MELITSDALFSNYWTTALSNKQAAMQGGYLEGIMAVSKNGYELRLAFLPGICFQDPSASVKEVQWDFT